MGWSNLVTGLLGVGFTGSYIFSSTIFALQSGCSSRVSGLVLAAAEFALFLAPVSFIELLPNFFYGAIMMVFGVEIVKEWLVCSSSKLMRSELMLTWVNFAAIMLTTSYMPVTGLEAGIAIGVLVCATHFAVDYSRVQMKPLATVSSKSHCVRPFLQRAALELFHGNMCVADSV